jgi:hypothetical protein
MRLLPGPHPSTLAIETLLESCETTRGRSSGPGGQHRNKVETKVTLTHLPSGISAHAGERRSSEENKRVAIRRLRLELACLVRCSVTDGDARSALWKSRCTREGRVVCNVDHPDFPALLAEALDVIHAAGEDVKTAAARLCCSMSQLVKVVKDHPPAFVALNARREARGLHPLR